MAGGDSGTAGPGQESQPFLTWLHLSRGGGVSCKERAEPQGEPGWSVPSVRPSAHRPMVFLGLPQCLQFKTRLPPVMWALWDTKVGPVLQTPPTQGLPLPGARWSTTPPGLLPCTPAQIWLLMCSREVKGPKARCVSKAGASLLAPLAAATSSQVSPPRAGNG